MAQDHSVSGLRRLFFFPPAPTLQNGVYNDCVADTFFFSSGGVRWGLISGFGCVFAQNFMSLLSPLIINCIFIFALGRPSSRRTRLRVSKGD